MAERVGSEEEFIARYLRPLAAGFRGAFDLTDDCAVLTPPEGEDLVLTTDAVAAGVHFFADDAAGDIAWKALAVNISDLAAKGARPFGYLMSLALPEPPEDAWMSAFAHGLGEAQAAFGVALAGGDTDVRPGPLAITITAIGAVPHGRNLTRQDAHAGDELFVTGTLGDGALGLKLRREPTLAGAWGLTPERASGLVSRYLRPQPRLALAPALLRHASAAMDISDGLAKDCERLCRASGTGAAIAVGDLPLSLGATAAVRADPKLWQAVLSGGDDYEILAAVPGTLSGDFRAAAADCGVKVTQIGTLDGGDGVLLLDADGKAVTLARSGWDHFAN